MFLAVLVVACFVVFFGLRFALGYPRAVAALKRLGEDEAAMLPPQLRDALGSRWVGSWQSDAFHEIVTGDISWAAKLSVGPSLAAIRRDFRWMVVGIVGGNAVFFIALFLSR